MQKQPLRVGIGGPVGSGKTALMDLLCKSMRERYDIAAITNDIYTKWDAEYLVRSGALAPERIAGFMFIGTPGRPLEERPRPDPARLWSMWRGSGRGCRWRSWTLRASGCSESRTSSRLSQHPAAPVLFRWLCGLGSRPPHQSSRAVRAPVSRPVHAHHAHAAKQTGTGQLWHA